MKRRLVTIGALLLVLAGFAAVSASASSPANPIVVKSPRLANLWLCTEAVDACRNNESGVEEVSLNVDLQSAVTTTAKGEPQTIGSFEFEVRYDAKLISVQVEAGSLFDRPEVSCASIPGEGFLQFRCVTKGKPEAPRGPGTLAVVRVRATADVYSLLIPNQDNGIVTQLLNQDCNLSDLQGHPIALGNPGGLIDPCGDAAITIRYLEGDVHADCRVDVTDQQQTAFRWGSRLGSLLYNSRFDLEPSTPKKGDGDIDAKDLQTVFGRHQSTCKNPHPPQDPVDPKKCVSGTALIIGAREPGVSLLDPATLLAALPISNTGSVAAENVQLTAITLSGGTHTAPASLPFSLGTIPVGGSTVLNASFSGAFEPLGSYALVLEGTYLAGDTVFCFRLETKLVVPPAAPGSAPLGSITVPSDFVTDAPFPQQPRDVSHFDRVNQPRWTIPTAPFEPGDPPPGQTSVTSAPFGGGGSGITLDPNDGLITTSGDPAAAGTPPIVFKANNGLGLVSGGSNGQASSVAEPSGGVSGGGIVFATANWTAAYSNDGSTFTQLDPTTIFPNDAVGFCCDQVVQYVPSVDRFFWFLQGNGYRLAMASPADIINSGGTAWTYWNLTPGVFGALAGTGFDYPDVSVGNNFLYMSWDAGFPCPAGCNWGFQVARISLAGLAAGGTVTIEFTDPANGRMAWGSHIMQDTGDEIFWAGHNNNKNIRVFSLQEGSNTYFWRDRGISTWANNALSSTTPDGQNWLTGSGGFPGSAIIGGTRSGNQLWFAWNAGTDSNFSQAHIEMVTLDRSDNFSKIQQVQIWNGGYAFAYPSMSTNTCTGEVGLSFEFGGGGNYENHVVGFWGDFIAYITTGSNVGTTRFGDYVTIRRASPTAGNPGNMFAAFGYGLNSVPPPGTGTQTDIHYVLFGRPSASCVIIGGSEG